MSAAAVSKTRQKPVQLQVNTRGSWAKVIAFDAADALVESRVIDAVNTLGPVHDGVVSFRIVTDDALSMPLLRWTQADGWKEVHHAG